MSKKFIKLLALLLVFSAFTTTIASNAVSVSYVLGVSSVKQSETNWCWAASGSSKLSYQDSYISQYNFATATIGAPPTNIPISFNTLKSGFSTCGLSTTNKSNLSFSTVESKIYSGKPIIAGIVWTSGGGHMVEIYGYNSTDEELYVMDPGDGSKVLVDYDYFTSNTNYFWNESNY